MYSLNLSEPGVVDRLAVARGSGVAAGTVSLVASVSVLLLPFVLVAMPPFFHPPLGALTVARET
jgi:hypothetical protein